MSNVVVSAPVTGIKLEMKYSTTSKVIIKELYCGGCPADQGTGYFHMDKGFILYNNSAEVVTLENLGVGMVNPFNAHAPVWYWMKNGKLIYDGQGFIPAIHGIWYFQKPTRIIMPCTTPSRVTTISIITLLLPNSYPQNTI